MTVRDRRAIRRLPAAVALATAALAAVGLTTGCTGTDKAPAATGRADTVAILLNRTTANRYIAYDQPYFQQRLLELCPRCKVEVRYAEQDPERQAAQVDEVLRLGAKVLVLNASEPRSAAGLVQKAKSSGVPVIAYDRLAAGDIDYYVSFDNALTGRLQGQHLLEKLKGKRGELVWIDGPANDVNAVAFAREASAAVGGQLPIAARFQIPGPGWRADQVSAWLKKVLPTLRGRDIAGVYVPTDNMGTAVAQELAAAGFPQPAAMTGQDAEISGLQRVMTGAQSMTVYKWFRLEAEKAAELAYKLLLGEREKSTGTVDNGTGQIPAFLVEPVVVTRENLKDTVIKDGYVTPAALCAGQYAQACEKLGIA